MDHPRRNLKGWDVDESDPKTGPGGPAEMAIISRVSVPTVNPEWVNPDTIHQWIRTCNREHDCADHPHFGTAPTWLIDVDLECLVSPSSVPATARYCALSYVWGKAATSKLTKSTQETFCMPGVFSPNNPSVVIPKTIRHAIGLVQALGEKYLWVDAFCVVQDDEKQFHAELRNMGAIYDTAYLTIVAATGWDANEGLKGILGVSARRQLATNFADDLCKYTNPDYMYWYSRGWTFQEGQFSRRMIMFCGETVLWRCITCTVDESGMVWANRTKTTSKTITTDSMAFLRSNIFRGQHLTPRTWPETNNVPTTSKRLNARAKGSSASAQRPYSVDDQKHFAVYLSEVVTSFNTRNFTLLSDLPRAFEGIAQYLSKNATRGSLFDQGVCWGLPIAHMPQALAWRADRESLRLREPALGLPSWSWFACEGSVTPIHTRGKSSSRNLDYGYDIDPTGMLACEWSIDDSSSMSRPKAPHVSTPLGTCSQWWKRLRVVAARCIIKPASRGFEVKRTGYHWSGSYLTEVKEGTRGSATVFPDRIDGKVPDEFEFLALTEGTRSPIKRSSADKQTLPVVVALWVVRAEHTEFGSEDTFHRRGVAVIATDQWVEHCLNDGKPLVTFLE